MRKLMYMTGVALALLATACACNKQGSGIPDVWPWEDPDADDAPWEEITDGRYGTLPAYVKLYHSPEKLKGKKAEAYIATVDLTQASWHVWGLRDPELDGSEDALKTPTEVFNEQDSPVLVMNGGFFYSDSGINYPASIAVENGELLSPNINYASEDWVTMYYPTKAAFIEHADGSIEASWTYFSDAERHYIYQVPAENSIGSTPLDTPSASFPAEGAAFEAKTAIGAGPVLIKDSVIKNTWRFECLPGENDVNCLNPDPRTAIGVTADKKLVLFVCEGREMTEGVHGYSTENVAKILLEFGCTDAVNLDGGGSTCLLVNGMETVQPTDDHQRSVGSCIYIK